MNRPRYLILHKTELDRIKKRYSLQESDTEKKSDKSDYLNLKSLLELSQKWIKSWPDTVQGRVNQVEKLKEKEHAQLIESVEKYISAKKQETKSDCIKKARDMIFEDSCYGRQLLSALMESKTLEERHLQVQFQKELQQKADLKIKNEPKATSLQNDSEMESREKITKLLSKQRDLEIAEINQASAAKQKENKKNEREKEKSDAHIYELLENKLLKQEMKTMNKRVSLEKRRIDELAADRRRIIKIRQQKEVEDERIRKVHQKYQEIVKIKIKNTFHKINQNKTEVHQHIYNRIKSINHEKNKQYNDFIETGVKRLKEKERSLITVEAEKKIIERNKRRSLDEENKTLAQIRDQLTASNGSTYAGVRQNIIGTCNKPEKYNNKACVPHSSRKTTFLDDLKEKEKKPSPWNSVTKAHLQFAQHANDTIKECRYKHKARKVINDYRKLNYLDNKSLPIPDY